MKNINSIRLAEHPSFHITEDLNHLVSKDVANIKENRELLIKMIENKHYVLDEKQYSFEVDFLYIDTTIEIDLLIVNME